MTGPGSHLRNVVVVGGGLAAASAVGTLREEGFDGSLVLVTAEEHLPYERPPLSKKYLLGESSFEDALAQPADFYGGHGVDLRVGVVATRVDLAGHEVTAGGHALPYDRLLLATGSTPRRFPAADDSGAAVAYLRTVDDADRIKAALQPGRRIVVVGGGWIGLEVAAAARTRECEVVVVEPLQQPLLRVLGSTVAVAFADLHRSHGVDLRTSTAVRTVRRRPAGEGALLELDDGSSVEADLVVVGIGVVPVTDLAERAGLEVDNGVVADELLRTSHEDVFVAGDIANAYHPLLDRRLRVEHWDNAKAQGAAAARNMLGAGQPYDRLPYFFTDQYDLGMEYLGHVDADESDELVVRGDLSGGKYTALWLVRGRVRAAMQVNDWDATDHLRRILANADDTDPEALRDTTAPLEELAR